MTASKGSSILFRILNKHLSMRKHPLLIEINALQFLKRLAFKYRKPFSLAGLPRAEWDSLRKSGFDLVWLMGVWTRSPGARQCALTNLELRRAYDTALPGWKEYDVLGSPYAIFSYTADPQLGKERDLEKLGSALQAAGLRLILDFVPNHLALDHPWTRSHPEYFVHARPEDLDLHPESFFKTPQGHVFAHGKDPYFPAWSDTVQVNFFSRPWREAASEILLRIAEVADGVRCDMAMLGLNHVFEKNWGRFLKEAGPPASPVDGPREFWAEVIAKVKQKHPDFIFIAEAYWDLEPELQRLGFDFTYDKKLYDLLVAGAVPGIQGHLQAEHSFQERLVRFIENHDEPRAAQCFGREKSFAAATVAATLPGLRFFYDGQLEGAKVRAPIQLARSREESGDPLAKRFYELLLEFADDEILHCGHWRLLQVSDAHPQNPSHQNLLAWAWQLKREVRLVAVNYSPQAAQGRVRFPLDWKIGPSMTLRDGSTGETYTRQGRELRERGLFVDLSGWRSHWFEFTCES